MTDEMKKLLDEAPSKCPITGMVKCDEYMIDGNVVYLPYPPYDAYTLPTYDEEEKCFDRIRYDMDDDFREEHEILCYLEDLEEGHPKLEEIKRFYNIQ